MKKVTPLSIKQFSDLAHLQHELNKAMSLKNFGHDAWQNAGLDWSLAIEAETIEILEWMGWKWWKGVDNYRKGITPENVEQVKIELVDLLHFGLSHWIAKENTAPMVFGESLYGSYSDTHNAFSACWKIRRSGVKGQGLHWGAWYILCCACEFEASDIWDYYIGKYALNKFRQENGYGDGSYQKEWNVLTFGLLEDNKYLEACITQAHNQGIPVTVGEMLNGLQYYYDKRENKE